MLKDRSGTGFDSQYVELKTEDEWFMIVFKPQSAYGSVQNSSESLRMKPMSPFRIIELSMCCLPLFIFHAVIYERRECAQRRELGMGNHTTSRGSFTFMSMWTWNFFK